MKELCGLLCCSWNIRLIPLPPFEIWHANHLTAISYFHFRFVLTLQQVPRSHNAGQGKFLDVLTQLVCSFLLSKILSVLLVITAEIVWKDNRLYICRMIQFWFLFERLIAHSRNPWKYSKFNCYWLQYFTKWICQWWIVPSTGSLLMNVNGRKLRW
jgi:hypothetical protein